MPINVVNNEKKKALEAQKERLQQELKYYDSQIDAARKNVNKSFYFDEDSSDSESECLLIKSGPSVFELKQRESLLKTCLLATQELTSLEVLQSEVNVLVEDPNIVGEKPITEEGVWREVIAECCVDHIPFSMTFFTHRPNRTFGPQQYRGLKVTPVKTHHELELAKSILGDAVRPGDAVEIMRNYSVAYRSRRTTLANLTENFAGSLFMDTMPNGGIMLKCANLMEISWILQNKWSHTAKFHHRMKFDLEYMDESKFKAIKQAHRDLGDPSIVTSERTELLSKIISICLEAQSSTQELYESMSSDPETELKKRRTTLDKEPELPIMRIINDKEVMAPPKNLPKRVKPKNKGVKRVGSEMGGEKLVNNDEENIKSVASESKGADSKKKRNNEVNSVANVNNGKATENKKRKNENDGTENKNKKKDVPDSGVNVGKTAENKNKRKNVEMDGVASVNSGKATDNKNKKKDVPDSGGNVGKTGENKNKRKIVELDGVASANSGKATENKKRKNENDGNTKILEKNKKNSEQKTTDEEIDNVANEKVDKNAQNTEIDKETVKTKTVGKIVRKTAENSAGRSDNKKSVATSKNPVDTGKIGEKNKPTTDNVKVVKKITSGQIKKIITNNVKNTGEIVKNVPNAKNSDTKVKSTTLPKIVTEKVLKRVASGQNKDTNTMLPIKKVINTEKATKNGPSQAKPVNKALKTLNKPKMFAGNIKNKIGSTEKENNVENGQKITKIPKKLPANEERVKANIVRSSPRNLLLKSKMAPKFVTNSMKTIKKPVTNIPRLMAKPKPKVP